MKAHIQKQTILGFQTETKEMSRKALAEMRNQVVKHIQTWFRWAEYNIKNTHLVYYVEFEGEAYIYQNGWIMDEREFEEFIANRKGVTFAGVMHRR